MVAAPARNGGGGGSRSEVARVETWCVVALEGPPRLKNVEKQGIVLFSTDERRRKQLQRALTTMIPRSGDC